MGNCGGKSKKDVYKIEDPINNEEITPEPSHPEQTPAKKERWQFFQQGKTLISQKSVQTQLKKRYSLKKLHPIILKQQARSLDKIFRGQKSLRAFNVYQQRISQSVLPKRKIAHFKTLRFIVFHIWGGILAEELEILIPKIGENFKNAELLTLDFSDKRIYMKSIPEQAFGTAVKDIGIQALARKTGRNLKNLKHLSIMLTECYGITDQGIKTLALQIGTNLGALNHLELNLSNGHIITNEGFKALAFEIGNNLENLISLRLDFSGGRLVSAEGIEQLAKNSKHIKELILNFSSCGVTVEGMKSLALLFQNNLKALQKLNLYLKNNTIQLEDANNLVAQIRDHLPELQLLHIDFPKFSGTPKKIKKILESVKKRNKSSLWFISSGGFQIK